MEKLKYAVSKVGVAAQQIVAHRRGPTARAGELYPLGTEGMNSKVLHMKNGNLTLLFCTSLVLLLGAGGLFYFSGHIQKSLEASSHAHLAKKAAALSSSSQQQEITKLALEIVDLSQSMTSELLLGIKSLAWALVGITLLQLMTIYSIYAKRKKQEIQLPGNETDCA